MRVVVVCRLRQIVVVTFVATDRVHRACVRDEGRNGIHAQPAANRT